MQADRIAAFALALAALGVLMLAAVVIARLVAAQRGARVLTMALDRRAEVVAATASGGAGAASANAGGTSARAGRDGGPQTLLARFAQAGVRWLDTPLGRQAVAAEERRLLDQCGFVDANARGLFLMLRLGCAIVLLVVAGSLWGARGGQWLTCAAALTAGFMLPKLVLARRATARRHSVAEEMPVFVDLLRLLQGVGLSLDQSLQVMINDFRRMLPVLSSELEIAQRQFVAGRTREQSLQRLATSFGNEDLRAVVRLMIQVDRHGGAVQEPLRQFGDRLRETRRAMLRDRIGRLTVKMTGVMILTLLPALLIVTAGPGVITATHTLTMHRR